MATTALQICGRLLRYYTPSLDNSFSLFRWTYHREQVWYPLSFPAVSFFCASSPSFSLSRSERGRLVAVERILQVIEFSAKAPWIIQTRGGRACSSFAADSDYHVYTNRWKRIRKHAYTRAYSPLRKVHTQAHTHRHVHKRTLPSIARLLAMQLCGRLSHTIIWLYGPAPSLTICCTINCGFKTT